MASTVDIIIRMIDQTGGAKNKTVANLKDMASQFAIVAAAATATALAIKKTYDIAKEGAQIQFLQTKFDRLSESIGTTADVLMNDLREATKGTYSDMELMASVTDLVGLGLANSHDEAVRLAKVSAGLNMNMNQLVLTLTNMTTMRFDALGVRVDGFKEKVKELEKQGYSTNDAFKEAFLQQAEQQLETVGNAADTAAGDFMRFEAEWKNMTDEIKSGIATAITPLIRSWNEMVSRGDEVQRVLEETAKANGMTVKEFIRLGDGIDDLMNAYVRAEQMGAGWEKMLGDTNTTMAEAVQETQDLSKAYAEHLDLIGDITEEQSDLNEKLQDIKQSQIDLLAEKQKLIDQGWSVESEKIQEINDKIDENEEKYNEATAEFELNGRRRILSMLEQQLTLGGLTEAESAYLLDLGLKWGVYTDEAVADAKAAQDEIKRLTDAFNNLPSQKSVTITTNYVNQGVNPYVAQNYAPGYAEGTQGWQTVPPGYSNDTYPIMLSSGEKFAVVPKGEAQSGASSTSGSIGTPRNTTAEISDASMDRFITRIETALQRLGK